MSNENMRWALMVEGIAAILFGIAAVFWPGLTIVTLLYLFATFVLISGLINMGGGLMSIGRKGSSWVMRTILGILQLGVGVYLLRHPKVTFATFILLIGFSLIVRGVFELVMAFTDQDNVGHPVFLGIAGALGVLVGIVILFQPVAGGVAFVWVLGLWALVTGPMTIAMANQIPKTPKRA